MNPTLPSCEYTLKNTKIGKVKQPYKPKRPPVCKIFCKAFSKSFTKNRKKNRKKRKTVKYTS